MNIACINGRIAGEINSGVSQNGNMFATFQICLEKNTQEGKEAMYLDCVAFRRQAEFICAYFNKGDGISVTGAIRVSDWIDGNGIKHKKWEIIIKEVSFLPQKAFNPNNQQTNQTQQPNPSPQPKPKTEIRKPQFQKPVQPVQREQGEQENPIQAGYAETYPGNNGNRQQLTDDDVWQ